MLLQLSILINFTAVVQAIILIVLLLRKKYAGYLYNRFLAILLGAFCIPIINTLRVFLGYEYSLEFFDTLTNSMLLIIPPTIYLYVKNKLEESDLWFKALSLHGIPFIVLFVLFSTLLIFRIDYLDELENIFLPVYLIQNAVLFYDPIGRALERATLKVHFQVQDLSIPRFIFFSWSIYPLICALPFFLWVLQR